MTLPTSQHLARIMAVAVFVAACDIVNPEPVCACSPPVAGRAVLYGEVIDPDGHLVENSRVNAHLVSDAPCAATPASLQPPLFSSTGGSGLFRYALAWSAPTAKCWAVWATPPAGNPFASSDTISVLVNYTEALSDSTFVRLQLR